MSPSNIKIEIINGRKDARQIVTNGIMLDNEHTCFYGFHSVFEIVWSILNDSIIYNATIDDEQVGIAMVSNYKEKEDEVEIGMCIDKKHRGSGIGYYLLKLIIEDCFLNNASMVHAFVRDDNKASLRLCDKLNFERYDDEQAEDFCLKNKRVSQKHFVIKKENH